MAEHTPGSTEGPPPYENWREVPLPGKPGIPAAVDSEGELISPVPDPTYEQPEGVEAAEQFNEAIELGHEPDRINVRPLVLFLTGVGILLVVAFAVGVLMVSVITRQQPTFGAGDAGVAPAPVPAPPLGVVARSDPNLEYREAVAQGLADLTTFGWVDRAAGKVRIPIDLAMERVLANGLPVAPDAADVARALQEQAPPPDSNSGRFLNGAAGSP